ncbi:ubiquitin-like-specific protease ESD4 [Chenopodium quinoa]|uniref:ubiquitin-like-specific protease ESD4 n=1 Tax=Chenopodium quinoa TaxID=63459 RepID=UPI000B78B55A|nr:ubiquitin-like-specific protease ESD4 [Chenopodium quinoa]
MGALTNNRKRVDECFSLCNQSPSIGSSNHNHYYLNHIELHTSKKRRISIQSHKKVITSPPPSAVSWLSRYPEPEKLKREVHAPVRSNRFGVLSSGLKRRSSGLGEKESMGNALRTIFEQKKQNAVNVLHYFKLGKDKKVIDVEAEPEKENVISNGWEEVEIVEDGHEVRSVVSDDGRVVKGYELKPQTRESDGKALRNGAIQGLSVVPDLIKAERSGKVVALGREAYKQMLINVDRNYSPRQSTRDSEIKIQEAKLQSLRSSQKQMDKKAKEQKKPAEDKLREPFVPLTEEEQRDVARAFSNTNRRKILVTHDNSNIQITGEHLQCLRPGAWLNDEVINVYLELLKERERREPKKFLNCHFFNTFFYKKLIGGRNGYDYKAVRRWTSQRKLGYGLLECDKIFVPIHKEVHWCLAVINKKDKTFQYLDSLGGRDLHVLRILARYFADEVKDKTGQEIDLHSWKQEFVEDLPEQENGFDCGVFMIKYADFYSRGLGLHFSQENMPYFRQRTAKEILRLRAD